jgi:hypothetical protein
MLVLQFVLPLHKSVLQQPVLSLDPGVSVLELSVTPLDA